MMNHIFRDISIYGRLFNKHTLSCTGRISSGKCFQNKEILWKNHYSTEKASSIFNDTQYTNNDNTNKSKDNLDSLEIKDPIDITEYPDSLDVEDSKSISNTIDEVHKNKFRAEGGRLNPKSYVKEPSHFTTFNEFSDAPHAVKLLHEFADKLCVNPTRLQHSNRSIIINPGVFIGNKHFKTSSRIPITNPSNENKLMEVFLADEEAVNMAVRCASIAQSYFTRVPIKKRGELLHRIANETENIKRILAYLEVWQAGKTFETAIGDIEAAIDTLRYYAGWADKMQTSHSAIEDFDTLAYTKLEPHGIVAGIIPSNYPFLTFIWKLAPSILCGNAFIGKPSELTPLTALKFGEICKKAGVPAGMINILPATGQISQYLATHSKVSMISFTGSSRTGSAIMKSLPISGHKKLIIEGGGKNAIVIFDDCNLDKSLECIVDGAFANQGQNCCAGSRIYVERKIFKEFILKLKARMALFTIGDVSAIPILENNDSQNSRQYNKNQKKARYQPFFEESEQLPIPLTEHSVNFGPLVSKEHAKYVRSHISQTIEEDGKDVEVFQAGTFVSNNIDDVNGSYVRPTALIYRNINVQLSSHCHRTEIFGPVISVAPFDGEDQAIKIINASYFGLTAGIFTSDLGKAIRVSNRAKVGNVWINQYNSTPAHMPFGGIKKSGFGKELGREAINEYSTSKTIIIKSN